MALSLRLVAPEVVAELKAIRQQLVATTAELHVISETLAKLGEGGEGDEQAIIERIAAATARVKSQSDSLTEVVDQVPPK